MPSTPAKKTSAIEGREIELLDGLLPGLYAQATGKPLVEGTEMPKMDTAMVDRVIKVLELRLKFKQAGKPTPDPKRPSWGSEVSPLGGRESGTVRE